MTAINLLKNSTSTTTTMTLKVMEWPSSSRRPSGLRLVHISLTNDLKQSIAIYNQQAQNNDLFSSVYDNSIAGSSTKPENCDHSKNGEALKSLYPYTKSVLLTPKLISTSKSGEGITWDADRRWNWEQRRGHTHLHCQHPPPWMYWEVQAAEGKNIK